MQIKINKLLEASFLACMLISVLFFTACTKETGDATVQLKVFGPSPALRGGQLKFIGINMDKVSAVVLPPNIEITDITETSPTEISITIPQNALPGLVVLKTPQGDITTKTILAFTEPITIDTYSPATVKAGDKFTINGDYLNLISQVIFQSGVVVDSANFVSQTRKMIELIVPINAQTGKVAISNGAEIPVLVYTSSDVQVTLPALTGMNPNPAKPGTELSITGTNFQLAKSVIFSEALTVTDFTVNTDHTGITVKVPATAKEGTVKLVAQSGVEVVSATELTLVAPVIAAVASNPVKNGGNITVTGTNLDLVTGALFNGVAGTLGALSSDNTSLVLTVPLTATDGTVVLSTNSGKTAISAIITYIKPTITSIDPLSIMAGGDITITGTNLDLVKKAMFVGGLSVDVTSASATSLVVTVPPACVGVAPVTLVTTNGMQVVSTNSITVEAANKPVITDITSSVKPGNMLTITGTKLNLVESIYFEDNLKAVNYGVRTETSIEVYVPETAKRGLVTLTMNAFDGSAITSPTFTVSGTDPIVDPSLLILTCDESNGMGSGGNWGGTIEVANDPLYALAGNYIHGTATALTGWAWIWGNNWVTFPSVTSADHLFKMDVRLDKPFGTTNVHFQMEFGGSRIDLGAMGLTTPTSDGWVTVSYDLSTFGLPATLPSGGEWGINFWYADGPVDISGLYIDNLRYELK